MKYVRHLKPDLFSDTIKCVSIGRLPQTMIDFIVDKRPDIRISFSPTMIYFFGKTELLTQSCIKMILCPISNLKHVLRISLILLLTQIISAYILRMAVYHSSETI